jgi:hypothetical protein
MMYYICVSLQMRDSAKFSETVRALMSFVMVFKVSIKYTLVSS